jgi:hypothetical protein
MRKLTLAALVALPLLAACAPELETTIYLSDVTRAAGGEQVEIPALLRIPQTSEDECNKGLDGLIEKLRALSPVTGKGQCITKDGDNLAEVETSAYVIAEDASAPDPALVLIRVGEDRNTGGKDLRLVLTKSVPEITTALASDLSMQTDFDPTRFIIELQNDTNAVASIYPDHVFVDGKPGFYDPGNPVSLDRRRSLEIKLSDVASDYVSAAGAYAFASVGVTP